MLFTAGACSQSLHRFACVCNTKTTSVSLPPTPLTSRLHKQCTFLPFLPQYHSPADPTSLPQHHPPASYTPSLQPAGYAPPFNTTHTSRLHTLPPHSLAGYTLPPSLLPSLSPTPLTSRLHTPTYAHQQSEVHQSSDIFREILKTVVVHC